MCRGSCVAHRVRKAERAAAACARSSGSAAHAVPRRQRTASCTAARLCREAHPFVVPPLPRLCRLALLEWRRLALYDPMGAVHISAATTAALTAAAAALGATYSAPEVRLQF